MPKKAVPKVTGFKIDENDHIVFDGRPYRFIERLVEGIAIHSDDERPKNVVVLSWMEIDGHMRRFRLKVHSGYHTVENARKRAQARANQNFTPDVVLKTVMVRVFLEEEANADGEGPNVSRSDPKIKAFIRKFTRENAELVLRASIELRERGCKKSGITGPRQFRRWVERFEKNKLVDDSLIPQHKGRTHTGSTFTDEQLEHYQSFADKILTENEWSIRDCFNAMETDALERSERGDKVIETCSYSTMQRLVNAMDDYKSDLARNKDEHRTQREYLMSGKGLRVTYPMQILEMDEQLLDVVTICKGFGFWSNLDEAVQEKLLEKRRLWVSVAMDAYSRSILALRFLEGDPSGVEARATLAMAVRNKEVTTALSQEMLEWPQRGRPGAVHTDAGTAYVSPEFQIAVQKLTGTHRIPPSKHPNLRGRVERVFRSFSKKYLQFFSGRTFSNILLKGQYDPVLHAHLTRAELCDLLVRLIVLCYHNTPHRGLSLETPLDRWYRASQQEREVSPPPEEEEYRDIFGIEITRKIGNRGITILGVTYISDDLTRVRKRERNAVLKVRLNDQNMHFISFLDEADGCWHDAVSTFEGFNNVPVSDWMETVSYINTKYGPKTPSGKRAREIVLTTLGNVMRAADASRLVAMVSSPQLSEKTIIKFEKKEMANFGYSKHLEIDFGDNEPEEDSDAIQYDDILSADPSASLEDDMNPKGEFDPSGFIEPESKRRLEQAKPPKKARKYKELKDIDDELPIDDVELRIETRDGGNE